MHTGCSVSSNVQIGESSVSIMEVSNSSERTQSSDAQSSSSAHISEQSNFSESSTSSNQATDERSSETISSGEASSAANEGSSDISSSSNTINSSSSTSSNSTNTIPENPPTNGIHTFSFEEISRTYRLYVPTTYDSNNPNKMIFLFHGWGGDENAFMHTQSVIDAAEEKGYILVAPRGLNDGDAGLSGNTLNSWRFRGSSTGLSGDGATTCDESQTSDYTYVSCNDGKGNENSCAWTHCIQDDVDFVLALITELKTKLRIDDRNIFAVGSSNGGMFSWELGQNEKSAGLFRAIAPMIGVPHKGYLDGKGTNDSLPVLLITGTADPTVPPGDWDDLNYTTTFDGDQFYYTGASAITKVWATDHGCDISGDATSFDDGVGKTDCRSWCDSPSDGFPAVLDCRANMGHVDEIKWSWGLVLRFFDFYSVE